MSTATLGSNTVLEWLDRIPTIRREMILGRSHTRMARVKVTPDGESMMIGTSYVQTTPLWVIVITKGKNKNNLIHRCRVWLRTVDHDLYLVEDQGGFVTVRGAEHCAWRALNEITTRMRNADKEFEREVTEP